MTLPFQLTIYAILLSLFSATDNSNREIVLPPSRVQHSTAAVDGIPATNVTAQLKPNSKQLESLEIQIGDKTLKIEDAAIAKIGEVALSTLQIRTEISGTGERWFTVMFRPAKPTENLDWYNVSIVNSKYLQTTTTWDTKEDNAIRQNSKVLHESEKN